MRHYHPLDRSGRQLYLQPRWDRLVRLRQRYQMNQWVPSGHQHHYFQWVPWDRCFQSLQHRRWDRLGQPRPSDLSGRSQDRLGLRCLLDRSVRLCQMFHLPRLDRSAPLPRFPWDPWVPHFQKLRLDP